MNTKKELIMDAAKNKFERFGLKKTTIAEICEEAEISRTAIYENFTNKEDLFENVLIREMLRARDFGIESGKKIEDRLEKVRKINKAMLRYILDDPFLQSIFIDENGLYNIFQRKKFRAIVEEEFIGISSEFVKQGIQDGQFADFDTNLAGYFEVNLFNSVLLRAISEPKNEKNLRKAEKEMDAMADLFFYGLVKR